MKIGVYQFGPRFGEVEHNLEKAAKALERVEADLLVFPELFTTGYQFCSREELISLAEEVPGGPSTRRLEAMASDFGLFLVGGIPERAGDRLFNTAVLVGPKGFIGCYRKLNLFRDEKLLFEPGHERPAVYDIGTARLGLMICFDWIFPEVARYLALEGADILCHPSNLVLPFCPEAMVTRSLENRVFSVTCNRVGEEARGGKAPLRFIGHSQLVSPAGEILFRLSDDGEGVCVAEIRPEWARDKSVTPRNDVLADRRTDLFKGP
jgi:predicted amidohydrolase